MALGVPGRLSSRIFSTFGTTRVVGRQPNAPAAFTPGEIPVTDFKGIWFCRKEPRKKSPLTPPGIDPGTVRLVAQRLKQYATPGPARRIVLGTKQSLLILRHYLGCCLEGLRKTRRFLDTPLSAQRFRTDT
jgi:hypothetical protein